MSGQETIASRFVKLNQIILGKSGLHLPTKYLAHRDGLLDVLFALYEECNVDYMRKDKHIAAFIDKYKGLMLELKSLRVNLRDFEVKKIIGRGHFGEVQVVREKASGDVYAMKTLRKEDTLSQQNVAFYKEERDIMSKSSSPWITKLQYAFQDSQNIFLIMEFHPGGDMLSLLEKYDNVLPEDMCQFYLAELVLAINSLHTMGYVHRDIKPDNILIDRTGHIKLADFGSASKLNPHKQVTSSMPVGTPDYVAPEVLTAMNPGPASNRSYGIECDWWSLGIVTYEMVFGSTPFADEKVLITYNNIMNFKNSLQFPPEAEEVSKSLICFIQDLLKEAATRMGYDQLIVHPLFTDIDWNNIRHIPPPFVPTVTSVDDTSNFDEFEPESRPYIGDLKGKKEFTGKNLPFVGFTYTAPFQMNTERLSSVDDTSIMSPSSSFCEPESISKKKEMVNLQNKFQVLVASEQSLKAEVDKLKTNCYSKDRELDKMKNEKTVLEQITEELRAEVQQVKQLLSYEREHRVITEQKAAQLVRCMKTKQRQDALRLRAKSMEFNRGERELSTIEHQLEEALSKIDDFVQERADLLEDLEAAKHALLELQQKVTEKEKNDVLSPFENTNTSNFSEGSQNIQTMETNSESGAPDFKRLVYKLEKKNIELETALESVSGARNELHCNNTELQNTVSQLENKIMELESQLSNLVKQVSSSSVKKSLSLSSHKESEGSDTADSSRSVVVEETSGFSEDGHSFHEDIVEASEANTSHLERKACSLSIAPIQNIDVPSEIARLSEESAESENILQEVTSNETSSVCSESVFELKQKNEYLKSSADSLNAEISKLKEELKTFRDSNAGLQNQLKEKESALSEAKIDLRISTRKEQQSESLASSLRERNKELREKIKSLEETLNEKIKFENELQLKLNSLESELSEKKQEVIDKQKLLEIEKAKHQEQVKAMQYTCEISKDVTQKFAKSQDHYEEICKQNMDLVKEKEEAKKENVRFLEEIKKLKTEIAQMKSESAKLEKSKSVLKNVCVELEDQLKDLEIIVEVREKALYDLQEQEESLKVEMKSLEDDLRVAKAEWKKAETKNDELIQHIEELSSEVESNNNLFEAEFQNVQDQLDHYKKVVTDMEAQNALLQKDLSLQSSNCKNYSEKIMGFESELCEIKEEAARHITQISSLKSSNLKLTQALEESIEQNKQARQEYEDLLNELDSVKAVHLHEKVKMEETIAQQTKLIDFLQSKTENMEKRKKTHISRLFGKKENVSNIAPVPYKDVERSLETEKSRCRRLQDQLSQARAEVVALQREIHNAKSSTLNVEVPVSPLSRAMHCVITQSPSSEPDPESPVLVSRNLMNKFSKPPGMKHKIPHRFTNTLCMRSTKCCACLDSLHFGRPVAKCQECSATCHPTCAASLPNTCKLPSGYMQLFETAINNCAASDTPDSCGRLSEGWIKIPKSNKLGWDRKYLRLIENNLCLFENAEERDQDKALMKLDFSPDVAKIAVKSAVSATELNYAASSDLPYVLKLEYFPHTTCWPQRCLYIMAMNFSEKQLWVSTLESLAEENQTDVDNDQKIKLVGKAIWTLKGDRLMDPLCTYILDDNIVLLGAVDGLYVLKIVNKFTCSLKSKIDGLQYIYQICCLTNIGLVILIQGNERRVTMTSLSSVHTAVQKLGSSSLTSQPLSDISDCHLFSVDAPHSETPRLCIATSNSVVLLQWDTVLKTFCNKKVFNTKEPCSCIHFTPKSVIFGSDCFYEITISTFQMKKFLDEKDPSLAGVIYGASQLRSFPVAIFLVTSSDEPAEYLMCFHEMGVFVNENGQRTRADDMKWSRLPLSFAYDLPYLFVTHFNSVEVIEISPQHINHQGLQAVTLVKNPQYLGPAHLEQSIYLSSCHNQIIELILLDGNSIGRSEFSLQPPDIGSVQSYSTSSSGKESIPESESLDFSFSASIDQSLAEITEDQLSLSSKTSTESISSQN